MFSKLFIEEARAKLGKEVNTDNTSGITFKYGNTEYLISKIPIEDVSKAHFQGHAGEGDNTFFVYMKQK